MTDTNRPLSPSQRARLQKRLAAGRDAATGTSIQRGEGDRFPLSFAQQQLWFLDRLSGEGYAIVMAVPLVGPLDIEALRRALDALVVRHDALRTVFVSDHTGVQQVVGLAWPVELDVVDLRVDSVGDPEMFAMQTREALTAHRFDLSTGPLIRASLIRFSAERHELVLAVHHIACDGWALGIAVRDLAALYAGFVTGQPAAVPELPIRYVDYAVWQREQLDGPERTRLLDYWRPIVAGIPRVELPTDKARPASPTFHGASARLELSAALTAGVRRLSQETRATPFMTLLTAFKLLVARQTGATTVVIGTPVANRTRPETEALVGLFANALVLRSSLPCVAQRDQTRSAVYATAPWVRSSINTRHSSCWSSRSRRCAT